MEEKIRIWGNKNVITGCLAVCILIFGVCLACAHLFADFFFFFFSVPKWMEPHHLVCARCWIELNFKVHNYRGSLDNMILMHAHQKWPRFFVVFFFFCVCFWMDGVAMFNHCLVFFAFISFRFRTSFNWFILGTSFCCFCFHNFLNLVSSLIKCTRVNAINHEWYEENGITSLVCF